MKMAGKIVVVAVVMAMAGVGAVSAQDASQEPERRWCGPAGTWIGQNQTYGLEYVVTVKPMGGGRYSIVAEGVDDTPPWESSSPWRGVLQKTGRRIFSFAQIKFASPSQFTDPGEGVPDIFGIRGELTMLDCDHSEIEFEPAEYYAWGQVPFVDDPVATSPPAIAYFTRVSFD